MEGHPPGVIGWNAAAVEKGRRAGAATPRWHGRVDIDEAFSEVGWALELFEESLSIPDVPLFSGGSHDCWPAKVVDAMSICRQELAAVRAFQAADRLEVARG